MRVEAISSLSFRCSAIVSLFCDCWIRKTIRNVTIVVPVLMTSCQVSEKRNSGPLIIQTSTTPQAMANAIGEPTIRVTLFDR